MLLHPSYSLRTLSMKERDKQFTLVPKPFTLISRIILIYTKIISSKLSFLFLLQFLYKFLFTRRSVVATYTCTSSVKNNEEIFLL